MNNLSPFIFRNHTFMWYQRKLFNGTCIMWKVIFKQNCPWANFMICDFVYIYFAHTIQNSLTVLTAIKIFWTDYRCFNKICLFLFIEYFSVWKNFVIICLWKVFGVMDGQFKKVFRTFRVNMTFILQNCCNLQTTLGPSVLSLTKEMHVALISRFGLCQVSSRKNIVNGLSYLGSNLIFQEK